LKSRNSCILNSNLAVKASYHRTSKKLEKTDDEEGTIQKHGQHWVSDTERRQTKQNKIIKIKQKTTTTKIAKQHQNKNKQTKTTKHTHETKTTRIINHYQTSERRGSY
jgi:lipopolysaccharide export LptBFGC system permease protein LptF